MKKLLFMLVGLPAVAFGSGIYNPGSSTGGGGGGGASTLEVYAGTSRSSPTATVGFFSNDFKGTVTGSSITISLNPATTDFIHNQVTLQNASFYTNNGTVDGTMIVKGVSASTTALDVQSGNIALSYGSSIVISPQISWPSGTHYLAKVDYNGFDDQVDLYTPGSLRSTPVITMRSSTGWVGMGTTNPASPLDVVGQIEGDNFKDSALTGNRCVRSDGSGVLVSASGDCADLSSTTNFIHNQSLFENYIFNVGSGTANAFCASTVTVYGSGLSVNGIGYAWPITQRSGFLQNDGAGSLGWANTMISSFTVASSSGMKVNYSLLVGSLTVSDLASGECVQTTTGGRLTTTGAACSSGSGGGSGSSTLGVFKDGVSVTSPTAQINFTGPGLFVTATGSTATVSVGSAIASPTGNYTATSSATVILANASGASFTVTLPTAVGATGLTYRVKRLNTGANTVTIGTTSAQTIDGATTQILTLQYTSLDVISDGSNWSIL